MLFHKFNLSKGQICMLKVILHDWWFFTKFNLSIDQIRMIKSWPYNEQNLLMLQVGQRDARVAGTFKPLAACSPLPLLSWSIIYFLLLFHEQQTVKGVLVVLSCTAWSTVWFSSVRIWLSAACYRRVARRYSLFLFVPRCKHMHFIISIAVLWFHIFIAKERYHGSVYTRVINDAQLFRECVARGGRWRFRNVCFAAQVWIFFFLYIYL